MKILRSLLILFTFCVACNPYIYADDTTTLPINLEETHPKPVVNPKPKAPAHLQVQAYYNGVGIVITSNNAMQTEVLIYDNLSDIVYYDGAAMLAPSFFCSIPAEASVVSIIITISSTEYQGVLYK